LREQEYDDGGNRDQQQREQNSAHVFAQLRAGRS
jgi:hypothetical protein